MIEYCLRFICIKEKQMIHIEKAKYYQGKSKKLLWHKILFKNNIILNFEFIDSIFLVFY